MWSGTRGSQSATVLSQKLGNLSASLRQWSGANIGCVSREIKKLKKELALLHNDPKCLSPSHVEIKITNQLVEFYHMEEILQRQRSRVDWLVDGDKNMSFFQRRASMRRRKNHIKNPQKSDGTLTQDPTEMTSLTNEFYNDLFHSEGTPGMENVLNAVPVKVTTEMNMNLMAPFTPDDMKSALFQLYPTKAPGPDGYPTHFFQRNWELCGGEVTNVVLHILLGEESPEVINKTLLVLMPKVKDPLQLSQFWPISFCNVLYKITSKVLANRLKQIFPDIISEEQSAFVPGWLIIDNIITSYECHHFMKRNKAKRNRFCAVKLDMMEAYEQVEWSYLEAIMIKLGFAPSWVALIMRMVSSVNFSVLFNAGKVEEFTPS